MCYRRSKIADYLLQSNKPTFHLAGSVLFLTLLTTGCDVLLDSALDCLDDDGPVFDRSILASPVLNQTYQETILVKIDNEPRDDRFIYNMEFSGDLPEGITGSQDGTDGRRYFLRGTPIETGTFKFKLFVSVDEPTELESQNSGLCYTTRSGDFELTVLDM